MADFLLLESGSHVELEDGSGGILLQGTAAAALTYNLTGPSGGTINTASSLFTLVQSNASVDSIAFSDASAGGTFTPSSLSYSGFGTVKTFTYTPINTAGTYTLAVTANSNSTVYNSPWSYVATNAGIGGGAPPFTAEMLWSGSPKVQRLKMSETAARIRGFKFPRRPGPR